MSPITVEPQAGAEPLLVIPPDPDKVADGQRIWELNQAALEVMPDAGSRVAMAGYEYVGAVTRKSGKKNTPDQTLLLYAKEEERDAPEHQPEETADEGAAEPAVVEPEPAADAEADAEADAAEEEVDEDGEPAGPAPEVEP